MAKDREISQKLAERPVLQADGETIKHNIVRIFGSILGAERKTGVPRRGWYDQIEAGSISDYMIGKLWRLGIDPEELIKPAEKGCSLK